MESNTNELIKYTINLLTYVIIGKGTYIRQIDKKIFVITNDSNYDFTIDDMKFITINSHIQSNIDELYSGIYDEKTQTLRFFDIS